MLSNTLIGWLLYIVYNVLYYIMLYCFNEYSVWIDFIVLHCYILSHIYNLHDKLQEKVEDMTKLLLKVG